MCDCGGFGRAPGTLLTQPTSLIPATPIPCATSVERVHVGKHPKKKSGGGCGKKCPAIVVLPCNGSTTTVEVRNRRGCVISNQTSTDFATLTANHTGTGCCQNNLNNGCCGGHSAPQLLRF